MKNRFSSGFLVAVIVLVIASGIGLASQWQQTLLLRGELERVQWETEELERLRTENQRLRGKQIPAAELEALRADHAAVARLRAELEELRKPAPAQ